MSARTSAPVRSASVVSSALARSSSDLRSADVRSRSALSVSEVRPSPSRSSFEVCSISPFSAATASSSCAFRALSERVAALGRFVGQRVPRLGRQLLDVAGRLAGDLLAALAERALDAGFAVCKALRDAGLGALDALGDGRPGLRNAALEAFAAGGLLGSGLGLEPAAGLGGRRIDAFSQALEDSLEPLIDERLGLALGGGQGGALGTRGGGPDLGERAGNCLLDLLAGTPHPRRGLLAVTFDPALGLLGERDDPLALGQQPLLASFGELALRLLEVAPSIGGQRLTELGKGVARATLARVLQLRPDLPEPLVHGGARLCQPLVDPFAELAAELELDLAQPPVGDLKGLIGGGGEGVALDAAGALGEGAHRTVDALLGGGPGRGQGFDSLIPLVGEPMRARVGGFPHPLLLDGESLLTARVEFLAGLLEPQLRVLLERSDRSLELGADTLLLIGTELAADLLEPGF